LVDHLTFVINIHKNIVTIGAGAMGYFGIKNSKVHNGFNKTIITNITGELMGLRNPPILESHVSWLSDYSTSDRQKTQLREEV
jgi:hypothetical protein